MPSPSGGSRAPRTSRRRACRPPGRPTAPATPASASVRVLVRERRHRRVRREHDPAVRASRGRGRRRAARAAGRARSPAVNPVAQITCSRAVHLRRRRGTGVAGPRERLVPSRPAGYDGGEQRAEDGRRARPGCVAWNAGEPAPREERARHVERPARGLPPPHRHHPRAGRERVQPLGRRRHPGADHRRRRRRTRAARRRGRRAGRRRAPPGTFRPGMPRRDEDVAERRPAPSSSKPPSTARTRSTRARTTPRPSRVRRAHAPRRARGTRRPSGGSGRRRSARAATGCRAPERRPDGEPGERGRPGSARRSPSASAAAGSPPPARATPPPGRRRRRRP